MIVQSMLAGEADLAGMAGPAVISNVLKGGDVIQVAALVKSFSVPLYVQPAITQIAQLSGKRVGVTRFGSVSHFTAKAIFDRSNVTDAVVVQTGGYPESMTALSTNAIAGAMIPAPQSVVLREKGFRELVSIKQIRDMNIRFIEQGIVARRGFRGEERRHRQTIYPIRLRRPKENSRRQSLRDKSARQIHQSDAGNMLDESYQAGIDAFAKDPRVPPEVFKDLAEQLVGLKLIDAAAAQKTPLTAYYDNRYVDDLEKVRIFQTSLAVSSSDHGQSQTEKRMNRSHGGRPIKAGNAVLTHVRTLLFAFTLSATQAISWGYAQTSPPVLVAYAGQNETVGPMWVGIEKGTFRKYGLDVRLVQLRNGALSMATLSSGQVQYNYGSPGNALSAAVGGMKIQCVASPVQKIPRELVARKEIRTLEDLRGKTFGVQSIGGGFWLQTMIALDQLGIDPEKYDLKMRILGDTATVTQALGSGGVDATVIPYSFSEAAKRAGANVLADIGKLQFSLSGHDAVLLSRLGRERARSGFAAAQRIGRCRGADSRSRRQAGCRRNPAQGISLSQRRKMPKRRTKCSPSWQPSS